MLQGAAERHLRRRPPQVPAAGDARSPRRRFAQVIRRANLAAVRAPRVARPVGSPASAACSSSYTLEPCGRRCPLASARCRRVARRAPGRGTCCGARGCTPSGCPSLRRLELQALARPRAAAGAPRGREPSVRTPRRRLPAARLGDPGGGGGARRRPRARRRARRRATRPTMAGACRRGGRGCVDSLLARRRRRRRPRRRCRPFAARKGEAAELGGHGAPPLGCVGGRPRGRGAVAPSAVRRPRKRRAEQLGQRSSRALSAEDAALSLIDWNAVWSRPRESWWGTSPRDGRAPSRSCTRAGAACCAGRRARRSLRWPFFRNSIRSYAPLERRRSTAPSTKLSAACSARRRAGGGERRPARRRPPRRREGAALGARASRSKPG